MSQCGSWPRWKYRSEIDAVVIDMEQTYKVNMITSFSEALTVLGLKVRLPLPPTMTGQVVCATAIPTGARAARMVEKRILVSYTEASSSASIKQVEPATHVSQALTTLQHSTNNEERSTYTARCWRGRE